MNVASMNLNLLVALDALLREAHVGRAARRIGLSQPAASHALKQLRELFGDQLLVRVGSRMELTPRAKALRDSVEEALRRVDALLVVDTFDPARSARRFRVMLHDHVAPLLLPALVKRMQREAPQVRLDVLSWQNPASMNNERARLIDLFVSCSTREISGFRRELLFRDSEATVFSKRLRAAAPLRKLEGFLKAKHVAVVGRGLSEDPVDEWLREEGLSRQIALRVPGYMQALQIVSETDLVAFVPRRMAEHSAASLSLTILPPPIDPGQYEEHLFYPVRALQDSGSIWLRRLIGDIGAELGNNRPRSSKRGLRAAKENILQVN